MHVHENNGDTDTDTGNMKLDSSHPLLACPI